VLETSVKN